MNSNEILERCKKLEEELALKNNMLVYQEREWEYKFLTKQANLTHEIQDLIGVELDNIVTIAEHLPEKDAYRLNKCVQRIWKKIQEKECAHYD